MIEVNNMNFLCLHRSGESHYTARMNVNSYLLLPEKKMAFGLNALGA